MSEALMIQTEKDIQEQVNIIQKVMKQVMKEGVHFGVVPGCGNKPTLLKPGSEKILSTFHIAVDPVITDQSTADEVKFLVVARGLYSPDQTYLGGGVGICSSNEEKYKWKASSCQQEWDNTPETRRRIKYRSYGGKVVEIKQIRTNPADQANTVLKMAKKRAQVDMTLTVTAASDIFTQDIEEMEVKRPQAGKPDVSMPKAKESPAKKESKPYTALMVFAIARKHKISNTQVKNAMKVNFSKEKTKDLTQTELKELIEWMAEYVKITNKEKKSG